MTQNPIRSCQDYLENSTLVKAQLPQINKIKIMNFLKRSLIILKFIHQEMVMDLKELIYA